MSTPASEIRALIANSWNVDAQWNDVFGLSANLTYALLNPNQLPAYINNVLQKWTRLVRQRDKWKAGLTRARISLHRTEDHDTTITTQSLGGLQGESGFSRS